MSLRFHLNSKSLLFLFLSCFLISAYFNLHLWQNRSGLRESQEGAKAELKHEVGLQESLKKAIANIQSDDVSVPVHSMDEELVSLVVDLKTGLRARMMQVSTIVMARAASAQKGQSIVAMSQPLPHTDGLKVMSLKVSGNYENLRMFENYVAQIQTHPVVITGLSLDKNAFSLNLKLIGK